MLKTAASFAILISVVLCFSIPAFAWDETGHKITAYIAWQQMTPEVRDKVIKTLLSAPEDAQLSTFYMPYGSRSEEARKREFFMFAATWSDVIRDKVFDTRYKKYNNANWHYHDTLWQIKDGKVGFLKGPEDGGKLIEKLAEFDKLIRGSAPNADKAIAIAWLEHLIGDLHQPLHTTGRVYYDDDTKGDQGGNLFLLTPKGSTRDKSDNLHRFWDSVIGRNIPNTGDACEADYLDPIAQAIIKAYPYSSLQGRIADGKFEVWEKESVEIATTEVYKDVTRYEAPSENYKKKALKIGEERMALAGYRMGDLFNEVFGTPPAVVTPATTVKP
jgi:S1/P1 Nuclease